MMHRFITLLSLTTDSTHAYLINVLYPFFYIFSFLILNQTALSARANIEKTSACTKHPNTVEA